MGRPVLKEYSDDVAAAALVMKSPTLHNNLFQNKCLPCRYFGASQQVQDYAA